MEPRTRAVAAVLVAGMLFGTSGTAQELGPDGTTPLGVGTVRIVLGALTLWIAAGRLPGRLVLIEAVTAVLLAVIVLDEAVSPLGWLGIAVVLLGLAAVGRGSNRDAAVAAC